MVRVEFNLDQWLELAADCKYLPENDMLKLCEMVREEGRVVI